ncbi:DNA-binding transcriptional regulator, AcrR family [Salinimicrobium catena]|uniref:DNA-binding transcriptional regulator, AcrR family n=1 Tax=Salinimicrobium catena TaxID=390640 RepID=A0A1H5NUN0_9FLAO|nr:TetR family transcriptional regulator C-terminal domain-containing protein [Salinimicrobium catena]SDL52775.1 DNA-binding transcriptional regulator, AcrR family [Salinimicrobium catena]SEF04438.1 DNA-binding transcriptional regulator, AcrR family [Salinimicrobium catena]
MATTKKTTKKEKLTRERLIALYMDQVLETGTTPKNIYKFTKDNNLKEEDFYSFFGSFAALQKGVWERFFEHTTEVMQKSEEYSGFSAREKLLTFYYTFFEILSANRSYVLFSLKQEKGALKKLQQLTGLRKRVKEFSRDLIRESRFAEEERTIKTPGSAFAEATWLQLLFLLKFWMDDSSLQFEKTDVAIEKSVNTVFDLFDTTALERVLDFGKFIWKEKMA